MEQTPRLFSSDEIVNILTQSKQATAIYSGEALVIQAANDAILNIWQRDRSVIGQSLMDILPELSDQPFFDLLKQVWRSGESYSGRNTPALLNKNGHFRYFDFDYRAIKNADGEVYCILHTTADVTREDQLPQGEEQLLAQNSALQKEINNTISEAKAARADVERQGERLYRFFMQAPAGICILDGPELRFEMVNPLYQQFFPGRELLGLPLLSALPELIGGPIPEILNQVYVTGKPYEAFEQMIPLARTATGVVENRYFNFIYQARLDENNKPDGVLVFALEVTDAVLAGRAVEENSASLRSLIMSSHYALMILRGRENVIEIANQQIGVLWDKTLEEITGKELMEVLPELEGQPFPALLKQVYDSGVSYGQEEELFYLASPEGPLEKYVSFYYDPLRDADGQVSGIIVACEDITEQVQARKLLEESYDEQQSLNEELTAGNEELAALNEELATTNEELNEAQADLERLLRDFELSEQRLRSLVSSAPFPIGVYVGREMRILLANQSIIDVWGKGESVIGKLYSEILPELAGQEIFEQLEGVYTTGLPFHARAQRVDIVINGVLQAHYFNYSFTPLFDSEGQVYGVMNTAAEVTDLQLALQQVAQSERNLKNIILQAPVAMCILLGPQHVVEVANELMIKLWGKPANTVLNKPIFEALSDAREQGLEQLMANVYHTGETFTASEMPVSLLRNGEQEIVYQNFVYQAYRDADDVILGIIAITSDVTEQVLARQKIERNEAELRIIQQQLQKELDAGKLVQQQKDDFIGMASHELKTPLTSLSAIIQVANSKLKTSDDTFLAGAMDKAYTQVRRMTSMINGFLNISRLESGKLIIDKKHFDMEMLLQEMIAEIGLVAPGHNIVLKDCNVRDVFADREKIGSVITNLLSNAVKYSPKGKNITVRCGLSGESISVSVQDDGIGLAAHDLDKIFDRYYRVESSNTRHIAGFGIGLYLSAEIVRQHGGKIWVESEPEKGSTFYFELPLN